MDISIGNSPSGQSPVVDSFIINTGNIVTTNLSITYNTNRITINSFKVVMVDFDLGGFKAIPYDQSGQKWLIYGTSGVATDPLSVASYLSTYPHNYFFGVITIYDTDFSLPSLSFDALTSTSNSGFYFTS